LKNKGTQERKTTGKQKKIGAQLRDEVRPPTFPAGGGDISDDAREGEPRRFCKGNVCITRIHWKKKGGVILKPDPLGGVVRCVWW